MLYSGAVTIAVTLSGRRLRNHMVRDSYSVVYFIYLFIDHNVYSPEAMIWNKKQNRTKENGKTKTLKQLVPARTKEIHLVSSPPVYLFIHLFIDHNVCSPEAMTWNKKQNRTKENRKTKHSNSWSPRVPKRSTSCPTLPSPPGNEIRFHLAPFLRPALPRMSC